MVRKARPVDDIRDMPKNGKVASITGFLLVKHFWKLAGGLIVAGLIAIAIISVLTFDITLVVNMKTKKIEKFVIHKRASKIDARIGKQK
jgi:hypothetical protein